MELTEATEIVRKSNEACPSNLWFYTRYKNGQYAKVRLFFSSSGKLCQFKKKSSDQYEEAEVSEMTYLRPQFGSKVQLAFANIMRMLAYTTQSGLWQNLIPELTKLSNESEDKLLYLYEASYKEQAEYLKKKGIVHITPRMFRSMMYDRKCIRSVYYGKGNLNIKTRYQEALAKKKEFAISWRMTYDNTIVFNPKDMTAKYSEEYRGQKAGHYYMLLDDIHAAFPKDK